jgi:hypothetical protein
MPVAVSPISLRPRFNAVGASDSEPASDPRQQSALGAAWAIAAWHELAAAGVTSATWFEGLGPRGWASRAGDLYPIAQCFQAINRVGAKSIQRLATPPGLSAALLAGGRGSYLSAVNLSERAAVAKWNGEQVQLAPCEVRLVWLDVA